MSSRSVVQAAGLWAGYPGVEVLRGIDLTIEAPGPAVGIVGASGAGKTTLVRALAGVLRPARGTVTFDGRSVRRLPRREDKRFKAVVRFTSQDSLTVVDPRLTVGRRLARALADARKAGRTHGTTTADLLDAVGLPEAFADRLLTTLSGGEKQRVTLAAAIATRPRILVLDEPLTAVDPQARGDLVRRLGATMQELATTLVLVTHDLELMKRTCEHIHVLADGVIVASGPLSEVLATAEHPAVRELAEAAPLAVQRFR